jgi:cytochrome c553
MKQAMLVLAVLGSGAALASDAKFELRGDAKKGETTYKTLCVACHGEKGDGEGPAGAALNPRPTNFTDPANAERLKDEYVYKIVKEGGKANGRSPLMIAWGGTITDAEVRHVAAYVEHFKPAPEKARKK